MRKSRITRSRPVLFIKPIPPWIWMASSSTNHADSDANIFPIAASPKKNLRNHLWKIRKQTILTLIFRNSSIHILCQKKCKTLSNILSHFHTNEFFLNIPICINRTTKLTTIFSKILLKIFNFEFLFSIKSYNRFSNCHFHCSR
jgi:hypothetical protein